MLAFSLQWLQLIASCTVNAAKVCLLHVLSRLSLGPEVLYYFKDQSFFEIITIGTHDEMSI